MAKRTASHKKKRPRRPLKMVLVKPAGPDCNMTCAYCFYLQKEALFPGTARHRMSPATLERLIQQAMSQSDDEIVFVWQGGEPTLMGADFFAQAFGFQMRYGRGQTVGNALQTNGLLIDDEWIKLLADFQVLVGLSVDGPEAIHDHYRLRTGQQGTWMHVMASAARLLDAGIATNALTVVTDESVKHPRAIYHFLRDHGLRHMQFIPFHALDHQSDARFRPSPEAFGDFLCELFDLWQADFVDGVPTTSIRFFESLLHSYVGMTPPQCTLMKECGVYVVVEHNGDVFSCDFYVEPTWKLGNIEHDQLIDMLNAPQQRKFGKMKSALPKACLQCKWLRPCRGGCTYQRDPSKPSSRYVYCQSMLTFFEHADPTLRTLASRVDGSG